MRLLPARRRAAALTAAFATVLTTLGVGLGAGLVASPAAAEPGPVATAATVSPSQTTATNPLTPRSFTGYGFDQCVAPSQAAMDAWLTSSPYWAVGIYIAGASRGCKEQPNLTPRWISTQLSNGWRLLPITVGPQASCSTVTRYRGNLISADPASRYAAAREQGRTEARTTVKAAAALGIPQGSTLWYDLEHFNIGITGCRESALHFLTSWTNKLHALGYVSGVYSSASSGIKALDDANATRPGAYTMPDQVWIADWNGRADVHSSYVRDTSWMPHARVHQYRGDHDEVHGGVRINIDSNYLDLGRGSRAPQAPRMCGVPADFATYRPQRAAGTGPQVAAMQCLLRRKGLYTGAVNATYTPRTERAVTAYQQARRLPVNGRVTLRTWTAILAEGAQPVTKVGSASNAVRRVQRALNAAVAANLPVTGVFDERTTNAVRTYQARRGLSQTGVVAADTWAQLRAGRR